MAAEQNLKYVFGAETGELDKGVNKIKREMKDLDKVSSDVFASIGNVIGVDTQKMEQFSSAIKGLGNKFQQTGSEGAKAFGAVLQAVGPAGVAIAGLGIAAAVAGFKLLKAEADAFKNTVAGANMEMATAAYVSTYKQALFDMRNGLGQSMAETESDLKQWWGRVTANIGNTLGQAFQAWRQGMSGPEALAYGAVATRAQSGIAEDKAKRAKEISDEIYKLERQRADNLAHIRELSAQITEQQRIAREAIAAGNTAEAAAANAKARELIIQRANEQIPLEAKIRDLMMEQNNLVSSSVKDLDAATNQAAKVFDLENEREQALKGIVRQQTAVNNMAAKEAAERQKSADAVYELTSNMMRVMADRTYLNLDPIKANLSPVNNPVKIPTELLPPPKQDVDEVRERIRVEVGDVVVAVTFKADTKAILDITREVETILENLATKTSEVIGELVGNLINGRDPWQSFADSAISAFGDLATTVGNMAIKTGVAALGIEAALKTPAAGALAIAAGMALVALGSAVKAGLANAASGNYSASMGSYSSTSSAISNDFEGRDINVNVTGTLQADGDQLVAVINNSNKKSYYTT